MEKVKFCLVSFVLSLTIIFFLGISQRALAEEKNLPPGISRQDKIPGEGKHKGWEKGNHKGWEKADKKEATKPREGKEEKADKETRPKREKMKKDMKEEQAEQSKKMKMEHMGQGARGKR